MKKALLFVAVVVVAVLGWVAMWAISMQKENRAAREPWAGSLGTLDEAPKRFPPREQSEGATKLVELASAAKIDLAPRANARNFGDELKAANPDSQVMAMRKAIGDYVKVQLERSGDAIDEPPAVAAQYLAANEDALDVVRDHLLTGTPIIWETRIRDGFEQPVPNLLGLMTIGKVFTARALDKARRSDPAAWDELHASWNVSRGLWERPDLISILIALASTRLTNAAARKMPLPVPDWYREVESFDYVRAVAASQQAEAWTIHHATPGKRSMSDLVRAPFYRFQGADWLNLLRNYTAEALQSRACDANSEQFAAARASLTPSPIAIPNLVGAWARVMRFRAELEATRRVLQLRAGETPSGRSQCSDGMWQVSSNAIRFSRDIGVSASGMKFPLEYAR